MSRRLSITVPLQRGETPGSFLSRLAQANGRERARDFARDVGLDFEGVVEGRPAAIERLADVSGCQVEELSEWALLYKDGTIYLRGEDIGPRTALRSPVRVCARCLREDFARESVDHEARPSGRAVWQVSPLRTCPMHRQGIVELTTVTQRFRIDDFAAAALEHEHKLPGLDRASPKRSLSELEVFVMERLEGKGMSLCGRLGTMPLHAVAELSETLGTVLAGGVAARRHSPSYDGLHADGQLGFSFVKQGDDGFVKALRQLVDANFGIGAKWGPRAMFGCLYDWLCSCNQDPAFDVVRDVMRCFIIETLPIGPGDKLFGKDVEERRVHSLYSLSKKYGLSVGRVRKILGENGLLSSEDDRSADRVLLDAGRSGNAVEALANSLTLGQARLYLNVPRPHDRMLVEEGHIVPMMYGVGGKIRKHAFQRNQLDQFLSTLMRDAAIGSAEGLCNIPATLKATASNSRDVVALLMAGKLRTVRVDPSVSGYLSILIDPQEVRAAVAGKRRGRRRSPTR